MDKHNKPSRRNVAVRWMLLALPWASCMAEPPGSGSPGEVLGDVGASVQALGDPSCQPPVCGDGVIGPGEACDDGNTEGGDGCSASCELDDITATPGDDRAGYVACGWVAPDLTCGPDQGCCAQVVDDEGNPNGPACADARSDCGPNPSFHACDGPEDCEPGVQCMGTRFGNTCGNGYYPVCHTDADCEAQLPRCDDGGVCRAEPECGNGVVEPGEACDDGNDADADGCDNHCELDDIAATPGDDRAGYVACGSLAPDLTCGPDQGCCAQVVDEEGNPNGPACAAARSDCGPNPSFHACDGPEDCDADVFCMGTRFGNICGNGYYRVCHTDADCESSRPECDARGICGAPEAP